MKNRVFVLVALLFVVAASYAGEVKVNGVINGKNFFQNVSLYYINNDFVTTAPVSPDGKFNLTADISATESFYLLFKGTNGLKRQIIAVLSPGDNIDIVFESTYAANIIKEVKGSADMTLIKSYYDKNLPLQDDLKAIQNEYDKAEAIDRPAVQQKFYTRYQVYSQELEKMLIANKTLLASILIEFAEFNSDFSTHKATFKTLYTALQPKYGNTLVMREIGEKIVNPIEVGNPAPDIEGVTPDGKTIKLSSLKGKYVLVDFWASWCRPCRGENPNVVAAYNKYKGKKFDVFSVSLDSDASSWKNAIEADGLVWKNHVCTFKRWNCPIARAWRVNSIPFSVLIAPDGKIVAISLRGEALQTKLADLIK